MKASSISFANIALIKYWGKRNEKLILPYNSSISVTVDKLKTHTTVDFDKKYNQDIFVLNEKEMKRNSTEYIKYIGNFLKIVRKKYNIKLNVRIESKNNFPTSAGLASSASGFSALAMAINGALNLKLKQKELSILSRQGSGSSSRSILGGFVEWKKGKRNDGSDSYAQQIITNWPDFRIIICVADKNTKKIKSRVGMAQSVKTSPMYTSWLSSIDKDIRVIKKAIREKDFSLVGKITESNCLKMHAVMMTTIPAIIYWNDITMKIIQSVIAWRKEGLESYFTIDAGPQVKIISLKKNVNKIVRRCKKIKGIKDVIVVKTGKGSKIINKHLF